GTTIVLPPLRARGEDVIGLADCFLCEAAESLRRPARVLGARARQRLLAHGWPGNVRELQEAIRRAVRACPGVEIGPDHLELEARPSAEAPSEGGSERKPPLSREKAYRAFLDAHRREPALKDATDAEVFHWLKAQADGEDDGLPASCATFQRYLRDA